MGWILQKNKHITKRMSKREGTKKEGERVLKKEQVHGKIVEQMRGDGQAVVVVVMMMAASKRIKDNPYLFLYYARILLFC